MHWLICSLLNPEEEEGRRSGVVLLPCVFVEGELLGRDVESAGALLVGLQFSVHEHDDVRMMMMMMIPIGMHR